MLFALQRKLIYHPTRVPEQALLSLARSQGLAPWRDPSGLLLGWRTPPVPAGAAGRRRLLLFHGNAGHALQRGYVADLLRAPENNARQEAWDVFLLEYPGFGASPGSPSESRLIAKAVAALDLLWEQETPDRPVFLMGESLGSAVACAVARRRPQKVAGLLLMTPFNNLGDVAGRHFPGWPVRWLLRERYPSDENLRSYGGPAAFVLAADDEIVPLALGQRLYEGYAGPKRRWVLGGVGHNDIAYGADERWWREALEFLLLNGRSGSGR